MNVDYPHPISRFSKPRSSFIRGSPNEGPAHGHISNIISGRDPVDQRFGGRVKQLQRLRRLLSGNGGAPSTSVSELVKFECMESLLPGSSKRDLERKSWQGHGGKNSLVSFVA